MAKLNAPFPLSGQWAGLSVYPLRNVGLVGRTPWGPTAHEIRTKPNYAITRLLNQEFKACSKASKYLRRNFHYLSAVQDGSLSGTITGYMTDLVRLDTESRYGQRGVAFSRHARLLEGINLSQQRPFDSVVRGGIAAELNRETLQARLELPALRPGLTFSPTGRQPYFKIVATLGIAPDLLWSGQDYAFHPAYERFRAVAAESEWTPTALGTEDRSLALQLSCTPPDGHFALVLCLGVVMGTAGRRGWLEPVKYAGCGKVLAAG